MKKHNFIFFIACFFIINSFVIAQNCLPGVTVIETQEMMDNFPVMSSNCKIIEGSLNIGQLTGGSSTVTNLNGLRFIERIKGDLIIRSNYYLTDLSGLNNLIEVEGDVYINGNNTLTSLANFEKLVRVKGDLRITDNIALAEISGFNQLASIEGELYSFGMYNLLSINGFKNLKVLGSLTLSYLQRLENFPVFPNVQYNDSSSIEINSLPKLTSLNNLFGNTNVINSLSIVNCDGLLNIDALQSLEIVKEMIHLQQLPNVTHLNGLGNLKECGTLKLFNLQNVSTLLPLSKCTKINGSLEIVSNPKLTNLKGLENVSPSHMKANLQGYKLVLTSNSSLAVCSEICPIIALPHNEKLISNIKDCATEEKAWVACGLHKCQVGKLNFTTQADIDSFIIKNFDCRYIIGDVCIGDCGPGYVKGSITNLSGLARIDTILGNLTIRNTDNFKMGQFIYLDAIIGDLIVEDNQNISFVNFGNPVTGSLIYRRNAIGNYDVPSLRKIKKIGGSLILEENTGNPTLENFEELTEVGGDIRIVGNKELTYLPRFEKNFRVLGSVIIENNDKLVGIVNKFPVDHIIGNLKYINNPSTVTLNIPIDSIKGNIEINNIPLFSGNGFEYLAYVGGNFELNNCNSYFFTSLDSIKYIGGNFSISNCQKLENFKVFIKLSRVNGSVLIEGNPDLIALDGLSTIDPASINFRGKEPYDLVIKNNPKLVDCDVFSFCSLLSLSNKKILIENNNGKCTNIDSLTEDCKIIECPIDIKIYKQKDIDNFAELYSKCNYAYFIEIRSLSTDRIKNLKGLESLKCIEGDLSLYNNDITNLEGLQNVEKIQGDLNLDSNNSMVDFNGLQNCRSIRKLFISGFSPKLNGLENLEKLNELYLFLSSMKNLKGFKKLDTIRTIRVTFHKVDLDFEGLENIRYFENLLCDGNKANFRLGSLDNLNLDNGPKSIYFFNNTKFTSCNSRFLCRALKRPNVSLVFESNGTNCKTKADIDCKWTAATVQAFFDKNQNGIQEFGEHGIPDIKFKLDGETLLYPSNQDGIAEVICNEGQSYNLRVVPNISEWRVTSLNNQVSFLFQGAIQSDTIYKFGLYPLTEVHDLSVVTNSTPTRCLEKASFETIYRNTGVYNEAGELVIYYDPTITYISSIPFPIQVDTTSHRIIYRYQDLEPYEHRIITTNFTMPAFTNGNQLVSVNTEINNKFSSNTPISKNHSFESLIRCSYDPNDKNVSPIGRQGIVRLGEPLEYIIRFQNTGNSYAKDVVIVDTLDSSFDLESFELINASHKVKVKIDGNKVQFLFNEIYLIDSVTNEKESHGFVSFRIQTKKEIVNSLKVANRASIYFDLNSPILTNTIESNLVKDYTSVPHFENSKYSFAPNPNSGTFYLIHKTKDCLASTIECYDLNGRMLQSNLNFDFDQVEIKLNYKGIVIIKVIDCNGKIEFFRVLVS